MKLIAALLLLFVSILSVAQAPSVPSSALKDFIETRPDSIKLKTGAPLILRNTDSISSEANKAS